MIVSILSTRRIKGEVREMSKKGIDEEDIFDWMPVAENLDLGLNATNVEVITKKFDYITEIVITLQFADAAVEWTEFLAGSALTNGLYITIDDEKITPVIKTKGELMEIGEFVISAKDNDNLYVIQIRLDFLNWCGNMGLQARSATDYKKIIFNIKDDLSSLTGLFTALVKGWRAR